ncbi:MAG: hypothetical protein AAFQ80_21630 [Cyanobacteria bacterium J06621_8]
MPYDKLWHQGLNEIWLNKKRSPDSEKKGDRFYDYQEALNFRL